MAISIQPPFELLPTYRPIAFQAFAQIDNTFGTGENALVTISKGGVDVVGPIPYKSISNSPSAFPGFTDYVFEIDIQKFCQDLLGPFADLPSIFPSKSTIFAQNNDLFDEFLITITYEYIDSTTGLLTALAGTDTSNTYTVFVASRQNQEPMSLLDYLGTGASPLANDRLFLTKSSRTLDVCTDNNAFLSTIQANNAFPTDGVLAQF